MVIFNPETDELEDDVASVAFLENVIFAKDARSPFASSGLWPMPLTLIRFLIVNEP